MKKYLPFLALTLLLAACSMDDDMNTTFTYALVPVDSVAIPDTLVFRKTYTFDIVYERPTDCHTFAGFDYQRNVNERIIAVVSAVYDDPDCEELTDETAIAKLHFQVERDDFYVFKFWQGQNEAGEAFFLTDTVPVTPE